MKRPFILLIFLLLFGYARGQEPGIRRGMDSVRVYFRQGESTLDPLFRENGTRLHAFTERFMQLQQDPSRRIRGLRITAGSSPEGSTTLNRRLSERRAEAIRQLVHDYFPSEVDWLVTVPKGIDWERLDQLVDADKTMPYRYEVLKMLRHTPEWITQNGKVVDGRKYRLMLMNGGSVWRYLDRAFFPEMRASVLHVWYEADNLPEGKPLTIRDTVYVSLPQEKSISINNNFYGEIPGGRADTLTPERAPFRIALRTNLLYDALVLPNLALELYLGRGWTLSAGWMHTWFKNDRKHRYHRIYGGELELKKYFAGIGKNPMGGHHVGLYGQLLTYDLEWGGKGYLGDRWSYGGGLSYGYSASVARRLNVDFTLGVGYLGGEYKEYVPQGGRYLWQATKQRHWFGPTKAEVTLVWLLGRGNRNE